MSIPCKVDRDFFKTWSHQMAYVLGFIFADGTITRTKRGGNYFEIDTSDLQNLEEIRKVMGSEHKISTRSSDKGCWYRMQIGSHDMVADLTKLGLTNNKTHRMLIPTVSDQYIRDFIRGYFDGDGNVWSGTRPGGRPMLLSAFTSSSTDLLYGLRRLLQMQGIQGGSIFRVKSKECSRLSFGLSDTLKLYKIMYTMQTSLFLKRKRDVFERFISMRA